MMVGITLVAAALAIVPRPSVIDTRVDVLELNHFYDENGRHVFDQFIFWRWNACRERFDLIAWRLDNRPRWVDMAAGRFLWFDADRFRRVRFGAWRETWTQFDPELIERAALPTESRPDLGR